MTAALNTISSFTWIILYKEQDYGNREQAKAAEVVKLLNWMIHDGQKFAEPLDYAPLSEAAVKRAEAQIGKVQYKGAALGAK